MAADPAVGGATDVDQQGNGQLAATRATELVEAVAGAAAGAAVGQMILPSLQVDVVSVGLAAQAHRFGPERVELAAGAVPQAAGAVQGLFHPGGAARLGGLQP